MRGAVVEAERFLNLVQSRYAFRTRLPIPEHDEALSTHAAMGFGVPGCSLAKYLHFDLVRAGAIPGTKVTILRL
jgi:hypothetical protein